MHGYRHHGESHGSYHHRKKNTNMPEKAWIQFLALRLIHEEPMHGYRIMEELEDRGYVNPSRLRSGSIYVILKRMEKQEMLTSTKVNPEDRRSPRVYSITDYGTKALKRALEFVKERQRINSELVEYYEERFGGNTDD